MSHKTAKHLRTLAKKHLGHLPARSYVEGNPSFRLVQGTETNTDGTPRMHVASVVGPRSLDRWCQRRLIQQAKQMARTGRHG